MIGRPGIRTPTSGVLVEVLYLCAVTLSGGLSAWAIRRGARPESSAPPKTTVALGAKKRPRPRGSE